MTYELKQLMPSVVKELSSVQQHDNLLKFFRLVANGQFPSQNIGFLLFMDDSLIVSIISVKIPGLDASTGAFIRLKFVY
jgi:hypothetical protein